MQFENIPNDLVEVAIESSRWNADMPNASFNYNQIWEEKNVLNKELSSLKKNLEEVFLPNKDLLGRK